MECKEVIYGRRSVRKFSDRVIEDAVLEERFSAHPEVVQSTLGFVESLGGAPVQAHMGGELRDEFAPGHGENVCMVLLGYAREDAVGRAPKRKADKYIFI